MGLVEHNQHIYLSRLHTICGRTSHKTQVNFDPDTKTKSFFTPRHQPNQFRSLDCNQVKFDPPHWKQVNNDHPDKNQVNCDAYTKAKRFAARIQNRVNFDHHHPQKKQVNRSSHLKQVNFGPYTVNFDPPHRKQVTFNPSTKTKPNSIPHTKIDATTEIKLIRSPI